MSITLLSRRLQNLCLHAHVASQNSNMKTRLGACVIYRNKAIHYGTNRDDRSGIKGSLFPAIHAEVDVVTKFLQTNCRNTRHLGLNKHHTPSAIKSRKEYRPAMKGGKGWCRLQGYTEKNRFACGAIFCSRPSYQFPAM
jgi:hypothetical protein